MLSQADSTNLDDSFHDFIPERSSINLTMSHERQNTVFTTIDTQYLTVCDQNRRRYSIHDKQDLATIYEVNQNDN